MKGTEPTWTFDNVRLAKRLEAARAGRSLRDLAGEVGVSASTLSRIERGERPDVWTLLRLADWLQEDPRTFFAHDGGSLYSTRPDPLAQLSALLAELGCDGATVAAIRALVERLRK
jgi:transcriptional regulator with XRE-family HTH domain